MIRSKAKYFAASNTERGFVSFFKENFRSRADRCYIIKGGPGTGKSRLMNELGAAAENAGAEVEYYYCSSDPTSLDGLYIEMDAGSIAVLDGTAPHSEEVSLPGAADNIIDLGRFWDSNILRERRGEIASLGAKKSAAYNSAYRALAAYGNLTRTADALVEECTDITAIAEETAKIAQSLPVGKALPSPLCAVGMRGRVSFESFADNAALCLSIADSRTYGISYLYFDNLLRSIGSACRYSPHPVICGRCDGILAGGVAVVEAKGPERGEKVIDIAEYVDREAFLGIRQRVSRIRALAEGAMEEALEAFTEAGDAHMKIEEIYISAMDFAAKEEYSASLCTKISRGDL